jgi:hypothetical protein
MLEFLSFENIQGFSQIIVSDFDNQVIIK